MALPYENALEDTEDVSDAMIRAAVAAVGKLKTSAKTAEVYTIAYQAMRRVKRDECKSFHDMGGE